MSKAWTPEDAIRLNGEITEPPTGYAPGEMPMSEARRRGHLTTRLKAQSAKPPAYLKERGRKGGRVTQERRRRAAGQDTPTTHSGGQQTPSGPSRDILPAAPGPGVLEAIEE